MPHPIPRTAQASCDRRCAWLLVALLATTPLLAAAQTQAQDCAPFERLFTQSGWKYEWPTGSCCLSSKYFACTAARVTSVKLRANYDIYYTTLKGPIPDLSALTELVDLDLGGHFLNGSLPSLAGLSMLRRLDLFSNQLSGPIPESLSTLTNLTSIFLYRNFLNGTIPPLIALKNLQYLDLHGNRLSGEIPPLEALPLSTVDLSDNFLTGTIPSLTGLRLSKLDLSNNSLTGPVPNLWNATTLTILDLSLNNLTGNVDCRIGFRTGSVTLSCRLTGFTNNSNTGLYTCAKKLPTQCTAEIPVGPASVCDAAALSVVCPPSPPPPLMSGDGGGSGSGDNYPTSSPSSSSSYIADRALAKIIGGTVGGVLTFLLILCVIIMRKKICPPKPLAPAPGPEMKAYLVDPSLPPYNPALVAVTPVLMTPVPGQPQPSLGGAPIPYNAAPYPPPLPTTIPDGGAARALSPVAGSPASPPLDNQPPHPSYAALVGPSNFAHLSQFDFGSSGPILTVEREFTPTDASQITLSKGALFKVRTAFKDGWVYGTNVNTDMHGKVPIDCLKVVTPSQ
ncbi:L domain-like protein [Gonapodya prolifera JEL478]|uniref:L domain-like protein n=1 Tax=Gonapodya prolifera (strain JEL478) TaxID=1344416 RepID=A0A139ABR1_GONPJ|nr:L domain-like protein [Gonapodya prolifera JEL478]|eukprot:KXS14200.1 L domain-like protein [Gonapodya prolifera JEL478]